jgi:hypothetical protein
VRRAYALFRWERVTHALAALYADVQTSAEGARARPVAAAAVAGAVAAA